MILNVLRVEQLRVEDMMKRSFSEFHNQQKAGDQEQVLKNLLKEAAMLPEVQDYSGDLQAYYEMCEQYWILKQDLQVTRVISHVGCIGVILNIEEGHFQLAQKAVFFYILVCDYDTSSSSESIDTWTSFTC